MNSISFKKWGLLFLVIVAGIFGVLWGTGVLVWQTGSSETATDESEQGGLPRRSAGLSSASWAFGYDSLDDMCSDAEIIIIGTVDKPVKTTHNQGIYMSYWSFEVNDILKGDMPEDVTIVQMGSPDFPEFAFDVDPVFLPGDRYLLFLRKNESGTFSYHPQGRFFVQNNKVYSMNYILSGLNPADKSFLEVPGIICLGEEMDEIKQRINEVIDSVQLLITRYHYRQPGDVMRYEAGTQFEVYLNLFSGNNSPGKVSYFIDTEKLPEGITISIEESEFTAEPLRNYESTLKIYTSPDLPPGSYPIPIEYRFEGAGSGYRTLTLNINPPLEYPTDEELNAEGLLPIRGNDK
jgi:hypothetical protein